MGEKRLPHEARMSSAWRALFPKLPRSMAVSKVLTTHTTWPAAFPFPPESFRRADEQPDSVFYGEPRVNVHHIDDAARAAVQRHYLTLIEPYHGEANVLDLMSSWTSHLPADLKVKRLVGVGMNEEELRANPLLTERRVLDLNQEHVELPFDNDSFDVVLCSVSVDYLTRPMGVFKEVHRVLKPGGTCAMSFSNRCFPTKVIELWLHINGRERVYLVGSYFHYTPGFAPPESI